MRSGGKVLGGKDNGEHRYQNQPAADTQQSGKEADNCAQQQISRPPLHVKLGRNAYLA